MAQARITKKPMEFPKRSLGAVQATGEGLRVEEFWFKNNKARSQKRFLRAASIESSVETHQEQTVKIAFNGLLSGIETRNLAVFPSIELRNSVIGFMCARVPASQNPWVRSVGP
jgi:hypothetical protein